jgi:hypothetical protein
MRLAFLTGGWAGDNRPMGDEELTNEGVERELMRIARSRRPQLQARTAALRAILARRKEELRRPKPPPAYAWEGKRLTSEQRREWFALDLLSQMAQASDLWVGPDEWRRGSSRVRRLQQQAEEILAADDPAAALERWRASAAPARYR